MQAIQSSLMEMFCKQVLTQQNGQGTTGPQANGNQQLPGQAMGGDGSQAAQSV